MVRKVAYQIIRIIGDIEIRKYPTLYLAKVIDRSDNDSFRILFDYIQGGNEEGDKIPMTSPVLSSNRIDLDGPMVRSDRSFSFVLPDDPNKGRPPEPKDRRILMEKVSPRTVAVLRFRGRWNEDLHQRKYNELMSIMNENGLTPIGSPFMMRYNSPMTPGPFRRNEVAVEISPIQ